VLEDTAPNVAVAVTSDKLFLSPKSRIAGIFLSSSLSKIDMTILGFFFSCVTDLDDDIDKDKVEVAFVVALVALLVVYLDVGLGPSTLVEGEKNKKTRFGFKATSLKPSKIKL
jgi:hypothetical protein